MAKELKELRRAVALEVWGNRYAVKALEEISRAYREMLVELVDYAVRYKASQGTLHRLFYNKYRSKYPWLPTRVIKGCMRDALRISRSFRRIKTRQYTWEIAREIIGFLGLNPRRRREDRKAIKELWDTIYNTARKIAVYQLEREIKCGLRPEIENITIHYSDPQDWRLEDGVIRVRTHRGWAELHYRGDKQLWGYLYGGWELSKELKIKLVEGKIMAYLSFERIAEVSYDPDNIVAVDINEDNVTAAVFVRGALEGFFRIETGLGRIAIAYSERRKRITEGKSTSDRAVKKALKKLREERRKEDIVYKTAGVIEDLAIEYKARVVVGDVYKDKDKILDRVVDSRMRHRISQWSASKLARILGQKPVHVESVYEGDTSRKDPFDRSELSYTPAVIRFARVSGGLRVKVIKIRLRLARLSNSWILDRDMVGALNIGLRALASDGSPVAFPSTEPHEVWAKLVNPHQGLTQTTELKISKSA